MLTGQLTVRLAHPPPVRQGDAAPPTPVSPTVGAFSDFDGESDDSGDLDGELQWDGCLRWLEEYGSRLERGEYRAAEIIPPHPVSRGISLIPATPPALCRVVQRDLEICVAAAFAPELGRFIYSVSIRLLCGADGEATLGAAARKLPLLSLASGLHSSQDDSDIVADRCGRARSEALPSCPAG